MNSSRGVSFAGDNSEDFWKTKDAANLNLLAAAKNGEMYRVMKLVD